MECSMPGLPVHHQLPEFTQTNAHWIGDAIQSSHPLSSPSPPTFNLSQHQSLFPVSQLFTSGGQSIGTSASASVLPMNIQDWFPIGWTARRSNQSVLKGIALEGLMLKLKLQFLGHLMWRADSLEKTWCWERLRSRGEGDDRGWDGWMASLTQWAWVWANSRR